MFLDGINDLESKFKLFDRLNTLLFNVWRDKSAEAYKKKYDELEQLKTTGRDEIAERIKEARSFGDLSENAEYHAAKRERGRNESRIRFLRNMIKTAKIIDVKSEADAVGLFDTVTYYVEEDEEGNKLPGYWGLFNIVPLSSPVENIHSQSPTMDCQKILREDHILILREGKVYTTMGQLITIEK